MEVPPTWRHQIQLHGRDPERLGRRRLRHLERLEELSEQDLPRVNGRSRLERPRLKDDTLFLYTQKTGTPVCCPLPPETRLEADVRWTSSPPSLH